MSLMAGKRLHENGGFENSNDPRQYDDLSRKNPPWKRRKVSAVRDFPPGCGYFASRINGPIIYAKHVESEPVMLSLSACSSTVENDSENPIAPNGENEMTVFHEKKLATESALERLTDVISKARALLDSLGCKKPDSKISTVVKEEPESLIETEETKDKRARDEILSEQRLNDESLSGVSFEIGGVVQEKVSTELEIEYEQNEEDFSFFELILDAAVSFEFDGVVQEKRSTEVEMNCELNQENFSFFDPIVESDDTKASIENTANETKNTGESEGALELSGFSSNENCNGIESMDLDEFSSLEHEKEKDESMEKLPMDGEHANAKDPVVNDDLKYNQKQQQESSNLSTMLAPKILQEKVLKYAPIVASEPVNKTGFKFAQPMQRFQSAERIMNNSINVAESKSQRRKRLKKLRMQSENQVGGQKLNIEKIGGKPKVDRKEKGNCYKCGEKGHWIAQCPMNTTKVVRGVASNVGKLKGNCFKCGEMGHRIAQCPMNTEAGRGVYGTMRRRNYTWRRSDEKWH